MYGHLAGNLNLIRSKFTLFIRLRWGFHQKSQNCTQKAKIFTISSLYFYSDAKFGHHL